MSNTSISINEQELLSLIQSSKIFLDLDAVTKELLIIKAFNSSVEKQKELFDLLKKEKKLMEKFETEKEYKKAKLLKNMLLKVKELLFKSDKKVLAISERKDKENEEKTLESLLNDI